MGRLTSTSNGILAGECGEWSTRRGGYKQLSTSWGTSNLLLLSSLFSAGSSKVVMSAGPTMVSSR